MTDNHFMIDCETLGTGHAPPILTIGAVRFDPYGDGVTGGFYMRVDPSSALEHARADGGTFKWWLQQSDEARREIYDDENQCSLRFVLRELALFVNNSPRIGGVWGNGACSDIIWLESAYAATSEPVPWTYRDVRDFRTMRALAPEVRYEDFMTPDKAHHALEDATAQALALQEMYRRISVRSLELAPGENYSSPSFSSPSPTP
jgi:hypothetical protein